MGRAPCCDKANVKKGPWSPEEDAKLKSYIQQHGTGGNWISLPHRIGLKRCGKSCRLRWLNYLRPNIKHGGFTEEEECIICSLYINIGSRWSIIAAQLPGRTDNDIKNYWNTRLKKKLMVKQRKEQQTVSHVGLLEHELKRETSDSFPVHQTPNQQVPSYWADTPSMPGLHNIHPTQDDAQLIKQDEMNRLLMKLEDPQVLVNNSGMSYQYNPIQNQIYPDIFPNYAQETGFIANTTVPTDIEAYLNNLMSLEASDGADGGNNTSTPSSASSWGEMSSLVNTPISEHRILQKVAYR